MLYLAEFCERAELEEQINLYFDEFFSDIHGNGGISDEERAELKARFAAVKEKLGVIDSMIAQTAEHWSLSRMGKTDLCIMRLGAFEIFYDDEVPSPVAISEAVVLAKEYGCDETSYSFINGILGKLEKNRVKYDG